MKFGSVPLRDACGARLAHSVPLAAGRLAKGTVLGEAELSALAEVGLKEVVAARLEPGDIGEDEAAALIADALPQDALRRSPAATGRINLHATADGLFVADSVLVDAVNRIDPAITLACLRDHVAVRAGDMVATVKIIPLAVAQRPVEQAAARLREARAFSVKPFRARTVGLVATELPVLKRKTMDKTRAVLEARLSRSGSRLSDEQRVPHRVEPVGAAIADLAQRVEMIVVFGASAVTDSEDVIPAAIRAAGGIVTRVGMPVDPGNLLVLGCVGSVPVIGAPGCARSPKENGFDWILDRLMADEEVGDMEIGGLGVGGLLAEIASRPRPRDLSTDAYEAVQLVVLAAGQARRMGPGGAHKLLAEFDGVPLVRRSVETAMAASAAPVIVVTGHRETEIRAALEGCRVRFVSNPDYASGMASSLRTGVAAAPRAAGVMIVLADMPAVTAQDLKRLIAAFEAEDGAAVVRAVADGKRGNPVILPRALFDAIGDLTGDVGARHVIETGGLPIVDVEIGPGAHLDLDTVEAIETAGGVLRG